MLGEPLEDLDLLGNQVAGRVGQQPGHVVDRRLLAVDHAEAVGHEHITERGVLGGELLALGVHLGLLGGLVADVLEQRDLAIGQRRDGRLGALTDHVGGQLHINAEQLAQALGHRGQRVLGVRLTLRTAQVRHHNHLGTAAEQLVEGGQRGLDSAVVGNRLPIERDVEIAADQNPLAPQISEVIN